METKYSFTSKGANLAVVLTPAETARDVQGALIIMKAAVIAEFIRGSFDTDDKEIARKLLQSTSYVAGDLFLARIDDKSPTEEQVKDLIKPIILQKKQATG